MDFGVSIPYLLSYLSFSDINATVKGLDQIPEKDWPSTPTVFQTYRLMIMMWGLMTLVTILGLFYFWRDTLIEKRWLLKLMVLSVFFPQIANQAGWVSTEMGRYPWIVQDLLRISDGLSKAVHADLILGSIIMFGVVYIFLFILFIFLLNEKIKQGPNDGEELEPYHQLSHVVQEANP